jgi:hypothetical protein
MLSERRDEDAATAFFKQAINNNGLPDKVVMDKSGANYRIKNNVFGKVCPFKADHDFILYTLGNKGELSQNLPMNATEIVGLSVMRQPLRQNLTLRNETQIDLGAWMKRISK